VTELPPHIEELLAAMPENDFDALIVRVRAPEELTDPKARAARALARAVGGSHKPKVTPEQAANALRAYREDNR
jgi:hypothetical protein